MQIILSTAVRNSCLGCWPVSARRFFRFWWPREEYEIFLYGVVDTPWKTGRRFAEPHWYWSTVSLVNVHFSLLDTQCMPHSSILQHYRTHNVWSSSSSLSPTTAKDCIVAAIIIIMTILIIISKSYGRKGLHCSNNNNHHDHLHHHHLLSPTTAKDCIVATIIIIMTTITIIIIS